MAEENRSTSWGARYTSDISHICGQNCPNCGWEFWKVDYEKSEYGSVVGFDSNWSAVTAGNRDGCVLIIECQKCFIMFWMHVSREWLDCFAKFIPNWPKD